MKKVFVVVTYSSYEDFEILGVFTTNLKAVLAYTEWYAKADKRTKEWNNADPNKNNHIHEFKLQ